jgi:natural product precursor
MKKIKLNTLESQNLSNKEMNRVRGGEDVACCCACAYANNGGSSTNDNGCANAKEGKKSRQCPQDTSNLEVRECIC